MYEIDSMVAHASPLEGAAAPLSGSPDSSLAIHGLSDLPTPGLSGLDAGVALGAGMPLSASQSTSIELFDGASAVLAAALAESQIAPAPGTTDAGPKDTLLGMALDGVGMVTTDLTTQNDTLFTADNIGVLIGGRAFQGGVSSSDPLDFYRFRLDTRSDINLMLAGLSNDADLYLIRDTNSNGRVDSGEVLARSIRSGTQVDAITFSGLATGNYYIAVEQFTGSTSYNLYTAANPTGGIHTRTGNLRANSFSLSDTNTYTIVSGNGNVDFGFGDRDVLDLSAISSSSVVYWNPATVSGGGVIYDPGNGSRVFDALGLSNGQHVLLEGLDGIQFQDGFLNLNQGTLPNDPLYSQQWNMHMIGAHQAWRFTQGSSAVAMGIIDSGLGTNRSDNLHPDIDPSRTLLYTPNNNSEDDFLFSNTSHGTAVYGIMAAAGDNGTGMAGLNWRSEVLNIDVFGPDQIGLDAAAQSMLNYTRETGQRLVVNLSLKTSMAIPALEQLIAQNLDNALFVVSSGNDSEGRLAYPAILSNIYSNVVAVGASWGLNDASGRATTPGTRINYSNYGMGLSLMAPSEVITTRASVLSNGNVGFGYYGNAPSGTPFNGTSAAAPHVSGVASLVWSANPLLSAAQVHNIMQQTAVDLGFPGYDLEYGAGLVNADAAVRRALALTGVSLRSTTEAQGSWALSLVSNTVLAPEAWEDPIEASAPEMVATAVIDHLLAAATTLAMPIGEEQGSGVANLENNPLAVAMDSPIKTVMDHPMAVTTTLAMPTWAERGEDAANLENNPLVVTVDSLIEAMPSLANQALTDLVFNPMAEMEEDLASLGRLQVEALWTPLAA
ncbi:MAG: S8 family serine peptidase [Spirulina sp.]